MQLLKDNINFRIVLFILFAGVMAALFFVNSWLVDNLRESVKKTATSYQTFIKSITLEESSESAFQLLQVFQEVLGETDVPIVVVNEDQSIYMKTHHFKDYDENKIKETINEMEKVFDPLLIVQSLTILDQNNEAKITQKLYYGETKMIEIIKIIPVIQVFIIIFFIIVIYFSYSVSKRNLQNALYVGIFKETAHQLGTPISSLLGWSENVKNKGFNSDIIKHIDQDIDKLKDISERFSKIGSRVKLANLNLSRLLDDMIEYTTNRIPKTKNIEIRPNYNSDLLIKGDKVLLSWAFENLIKNSIEAISESSGKIEINAEQVNSKTVIEFIDSGKGIQRLDWKKIFSPGYSTKSRGWGVGLSLTKRIICEIHLGKIYVADSSKGNTVIKISI